MVSIDRYRERVERRHLVRCFRRVRVATIFALWLVTAAASALAQSPMAVTPGIGDASAPIEHDYVGVAKCRSCHKKELMGDQIAVWRRGPHHSSWATLESPESIALGQSLGLTEPPAESAECLVCHVTAFGVPPDRIARSLDLADGVQCESCHGPGRRYRKKKIMSDPDKARANGLWVISADSGICERCHNAQSPTFKTDRFVRQDGSTSAFDYELAVEAIAHPIPEHVKGRYLELDAERRKKLKEASD